MPVVLIAGPPCSGKTTLALAEQERHGGHVLDWDAIRAERAGTDADIEAAFRQRAQAMAVQARRHGRWLWLIRCAPVKQNRGMLRRIYGANSVVLEVSASECIRRMRESGRPDDGRAVIWDWWDRYMPGEHDLIIREWDGVSDPIHSHAT